MLGVFFKNAKVNRTCNSVFQQAGQEEAKPVSSNVAAAVSADFNRFVIFRNFNITNIGRQR
jgi:hypothetical protein